MTFAEYWQENEPFGSNPEDVAELAWNAAIEQCAKIAEEYPWVYQSGRDLRIEIATTIRAGATKASKIRKGRKYDDQRSS